MLNFNQEMRFPKLISQRQIGPFVIEWTIRKGSMK